MPDPTASSLYGEHIKVELSNQEARKTSFEQRGLAVVTTAGTLVTLVFGLAAIATATATGKSSPLGHAERLWLTGAVCAFVLSSVPALLTNWPMKYKGTDAPSLGERLKAEPEDKPQHVERDLAELQLEILERAEEKNRLKGEFLTAALVLEIVAVACVCVAVVLLISP
jgi:hypothetical protein